jgi:iron-sulfur cluster repair protein YtfE (RIC family)
MRKSYVLNNGLMEVTKGSNKQLVTSIEKIYVTNLEIESHQTNVLEKLQNEQIEYFKERDVKINFINNSMVQAIVGLIHMMGMAYATKEKKNSIINTTTSNPTTSNDMDNVDQGVPI